jgi:small subunit ribosomal protein S5
MAKPELAAEKAPDAAEAGQKPGRPQREGREGREGKGGGKGKGGKGKPRERDGEREEGGELVERLVAVNRVSKTVKGGRRMGFAAIVVVGDGRGRIGAGAGKAREVPEAIKKATDQAKRSMVRVPLREGRTLHHDIEARFGAGRVRLRAARPGTGIIAGGPLRAVFEVLGVQDIVAKSIGSSNPYNMVKAALTAFKDMESPRMVATRRGKRINEVLGRKADAKENADG